MRLLALTALLLSTAPALAQDADALLARFLRDRGEDIDACFTDMPQMTPRWRRHGRRSKPCWTTCLMT